MTTLTLFCPDLFASEMPDSSAARPSSLPTLERILAQASYSEDVCGDATEWLCCQFGVRRQEDWPSAALSLIGLGVDPQDGYWLHADPVQLTADRDRLILTATLQPGDAESEAVLASLNRHFSDSGLQFLAPAPGAWFVRVFPPPRLVTTPLPRAKGRSIDALLPTGQDGKRWHAISNEVQMLLHAHPVNLEREQRRAPLLNSLWFWGSGVLPAVEKPFDFVAGHSALLRGLGLPLPCHAVTGGFGSVTGRRAFVELAHEAGENPRENFDAWQQVLLEWENLWFRPIVDALRDGRLAEVCIATVQNGRQRQWYCRRRDLWKFWRRSEPLASLSRKKSS
ncbi:MAG: hypothetical protein ACKVP2_04705 [Burkholderiales bacterium]